MVRARLDGMPAGARGFRIGLSDRGFAMPGEGGDAPAPGCGGPALRVLIAEDDPVLAAALARFLRGAGISVECAADGREAVRLLDAPAFDLLVLDLGLPVVSGMQVLEQVSARRSGLPVLLISAFDDAMERVRWQGLAVDDFLPKPFGLDEFAQKVNRLVSRAPPSAPGPSRFGPLVCDPAGAYARLDGIDLELTAPESALLALLAERAGGLVAPEELARRLSGFEADRESVDVCMRRLRERLAGSALRVVTVRGLGFRLEDLRSPAATNPPA